MICRYCNSTHVHKDGQHNGQQRYRCLECRKRFDDGLYTTKYIEHFGAKLKDKSTNKLTRENYCTPTNKTEYEVRKIIEQIEVYKKHNMALPLLTPSCYVNLPNEIFIDKDTYTDEWVKQHYENCMYNYDLNIRYFGSLNKEEFDEALNRFVKKYKMVQVFDLNKAPMAGVYMLVLDEYKQVYIGISYCIKKRILSHWNHKKEFGKLIFGSRETSVLAIDSFGALDTTRIYVKRLMGEDINALEAKMVANLDDKFTLNRVRGGLNSDIPNSMRGLLAMSSMKERDLENIQPNKSQ